MMHGGRYFELERFRTRLGSYALFRSFSGSAGHIAGASTLCAPQRFQIFNMLFDQVRIRVQQKYWHVVVIFFFTGRVYLWKRQVAYSGTSFWRSKPSTRVCWMSCAIASKVECYPRGSGRPQTLVWAGDLLCQAGLEKSKKGLCRLIVGRVVGGNPWYV